MAYRTKVVETDLEIDPNNLDREWMEQPRLYFRYAAELSDARKELDIAKSRQDLLKAELDTAIRNDPEVYGVRKVTEGSITSAIMTREEWRDAAKQVLDAKHVVDVLSAAVTALDHRRKALEGMVQLFLANYFSRPRAPKGDEEAVEEMERTMIRRCRRG